MTISGSSLHSLVFATLQLCKRSICDRKAAIPLFIKHLNCDKMKETSAHILAPYKRSVHLVLSR